MDTSLGSATLHTDPPDALVLLHGELDLATVPGMSARFAESVAAGCRHFRFDMTEVSFCDASTVRMVVRLDRELRAVGGSMAIVDASRCVRRVFALVGLDGMLDAATAPVP